MINLHDISVDYKLPKFIINHLKGILKHASNDTFELIMGKKEIFWIRANYTGFDKRVRINFTSNHWIEKEIPIKLEDLHMTIIND